MDFGEIKGALKWLGVGLMGLALLVTILFGISWGYASYKVYLKELEGRAKLAEAEFEKRILVEDARAKRDSAKMMAEAEVERAKGVAQANEIIGESLNNNEAYLRYLWIQGLQDGNSEVIYVPTEANLPILEAARFNKQLQKRLEKLKASKKK
jgi:regulator of protease activity HflC (stomatin/prohibitin superfamily)